MKKRRQKKDILTELLTAVPPEELINMLQELAEEDSDIRRYCLDYLQNYLPLNPEQSKKTEGEIALTLWSVLEPDLSELDEYGGGDYNLGDRVEELLYKIIDLLSTENIGADYRARLLEEALPYIKSGNAGLDDALGALALAACYSDNELWKLAQALEAMPREWNQSEARRIYRALGDRENYLRLRGQQMVYGADYHDLATFYWEAGEQDQALKVAEDGYENGQGRMNELHLFLAERAAESGDRERFLELRLEQATDRISLKSYKIFKKICTKTEWELYEAKVIAKLEDTWNTDQLKVRMHRREYDKALAVLLAGDYPLGWDDTYEARTAGKLAERYPEEILKYYVGGLGNISSSATRNVYSQKARLTARIRRYLIEVIGDENRWLVFARKIKRANLRRPAFQDEFGKYVPGWQTIC